ncbi:MAG: CDP-alcohol phosphatidyltransferase family protein [Pseudomonadales bacterium]
MTATRAINSLPNVLSASRFLLSLFMAWAIIELHWFTAAALFVLAVTTDLLDGYAARRLNSASPLGGLLDHSADAAFVIITMGCFAWITESSMLLPILTGMAFAQYALDSNAHLGQSLIASHLGRYNGIGYFIFSGILILSEIFNPDHHYWSLLIKSTEAILMITTVLSMADRLRRSLIH